MLDITHIEKLRVVNFLRSILRPCVYYQVSTTDFKEKSILFEQLGECGANDISVEFYALVGVHQAKARLKII